MKASLRGQDVVYCAISGDALPEIAKVLVTAMEEVGVKRLIFMGAVGIYNEIPDEIEGEDNLDSEPAKGYTTPVPALVKFAVQLILNDDLYVRKSVSITHDAAVK